MVNFSSNSLDRTFAAVADPTRRAILQRLTQGEASVKQLAAPFAMSLPAISKHLTILERSGLVRRHKIGRVHHCHLVGQPLAEAAHWLSAYQPFWEAKLDALEDYLNDSGDEAPHGRPNH